MGESTIRADPDALLKRVTEAEARSSRAKLKVYFGFAPGVGKTYAMLEAARGLAAEGTDVAVGVVETHGRRETEALLEGLEVLPRRTVEYRAVSLQELDLDGALARRPAILLVDELAHSNAPGVRHAKRWQDVLDLLDAGIEVHTTLNVQHVESLNDIVAQITTVRVRETVPDAILERADEIELIDLPADDLISRLKEGKVYVPDEAARAVESFFRRGNLLALREIALRRTADLVDVDVRAYREEHGIGVAWPAKERVVVGVSPSPSSARLVRAARRMADGLKASWTAVWVEGPKPLAPADHDRLDAHLRLVESLGGDVARLAGTRPAEAILQYARRHNVSRILVGKPTHPRLRDFGRSSLLDELVRGSGSIDIHVISGDPGHAVVPDSEERGRRSAWPDYLLAFEIVAVATGIAAFAERFLALPDIVMVFLAAVMLAAVRVGRGPTVFAAALSVAAYDFFFVPPPYTFDVEDTRHVLTFVMMFVVGVILSELMRRLRTQERDARHREAHTAALYALARDLGAAGDAAAVARAIATRAADAFEGTAIVLLPGASGGLEEAAREGEAILDPRDLGVARWAHEHGRPAGLGTDTIPGAGASCVPLRTEGKRFGVLAFVPKIAGRAPDAEQRHLLDALAGQGAVAIERAGLAGEAEKAELRARTEQMRSALLSGVSHDLRTPLAAIAGAATVLRDERVDGASRAELAATIWDEAARLERLVGNLLDMTRLEAGAIEVKRAWVPPDELVGAVLTRLDAALSGREVRATIEAGVPFLHVDPVLFEQVLMNLMDNALKHTPAGTPIEIRIRPVSEGTAVEIRDRGPGIAVGAEKRIFEKFQRGPGAVPRGAGLGLAICRGIVEAHGGSIRAANREAGGAVFTVLLPPAVGPS